MIAQPLGLPPEDVPRRARSARAAVARRRGLRRQARYALLGRIVVSVSLATFAIGIYLGLLANLTRMNYELAKNAERQAALVDEGARLDDDIARLESRERLAALGARLGMHEAQNFAAIDAPAAAPELAPVPAGLAFFAWRR